MNKLRFKFLFFKHSLMQFLGFKKTDVIKIWQDEETQNTCLYLKGRSGLYYMPVGVECKENKEVYSHWIVSIYHMSKYKIFNDKKNRSTVYSLSSIKERN